MAKKITKKELESKVAYLEREKVEITKERDSALALIESGREHLETVKVDIYDMLRPKSEENRCDLVADWSPMRQPPKRRVSLSQIARRAGRLVTIEDEYIELKDRTLPIPKMKVLQDDRDDRRNGGRGSGINVH